MNTVFLNPGHAPGLDPGAVNKKYNVNEAEIVEDICDLVEHYLVEAGCVVKSMQSDNLNGGKNYNKYYSVVATANRLNPHVFVSVHCNSTDKTDPSIRGTETWAYSPQCKGAQLAACIQKQLISSIDTVDRGVRYNTDYGESWAVLAEVNCPSCLVETAFITSDYDVKLLTEEVDEFARAIARGVTDYLKEVN